MNIKFISIGSYPWQKKENLTNIGLLMKFHDPETTSSPAYFQIIDEQLFFLSVIQYGIEFKELTDLEIEERLKDYQQERKRYRKLLVARVKEYKSKR